MLPFTDPPFCSMRVEKSLRGTVSVPVMQKIFPESAILDPAFKFNVRGPFPEDLFVVWKRSRPPPRELKQKKRDTVHCRAVDLMGKHSKKKKGGRDPATAPTEEAKGNGYEIRPSLGPGFVFVTRADQFSLACDAILVNSQDSGADLSCADGKEDEFQLDEVSGESVNPIKRLKASLYSKIGRTKLKIRPVENILGRLDTQSMDVVTPEIFFCSWDDRQGPPELNRILECFIRFTAAEITKPRNRRQRLLLAVPTICRTDGTYLKRQYETLTQLCERFEVDVAWTMIDRSKFTLVQTIRQNLDDGDNDPQKHLPKSVRGEIRRLAKEVISKRLTLFIGAGVSVAAGLPTWGGLLNKLRDKLKGQLSRR